MCGKDYLFSALMLLVGRLQGHPALQISKEMPSVLWKFGLVNEKLKVVVRGIAGRGSPGV